MTGKWHVKETKKSRCAEIPMHQIIEIGNLETSQIQIENLKYALIFAEIVTDDIFLFSLKDNKIEIHFMQCVYLFENQCFLFDYQGDFNFEMQEKISYEKINIIYHSDLFLDALNKMQEHFSSHFDEFIIKLNKPKYYLEILGFLCHHLEKNFFIRGSIFKKEDRFEFKCFLWVLWSHIFEYGILSKILKDDTVSEVMVNDPKRIYVEKSGKIYPSPLQFRSSQDLMYIIERVCSFAGKRLDESSPYCDARLKNGYRINAVIPPIALNGPCLTIRKFPQMTITPKLLVEKKSLTQEMSNFLKILVQDKKNILISGGTGSGKTTLLNCLSSFIPETERIITIEDSAELQLQQEHVIRMESRSENQENKGRVSIRDLLKNALRMRPDRIIVGECRGEEALDMLQAMNTGHDGSLTTVHANSPRDALRRLETLVLFSGFNLPSRAIRDQITSAIHYVVQQTRLSTGERKVTSICEMIGICPKNSDFIMKDIF